MTRWTKLSICTDPAYLHPVLRAKLPAILQDVQGHFDPTKVQFRIFETGRSMARQLQLILKGTSHTKCSKHLTGRACDIVPYVKGPHGQWSPTWNAIVGDDGRTWIDLLTSSAVAHGLVRVYFKGPNGRYVDGPHVQLPENIADTYPGW
jgi:hypothetical protein